MNTTTSKVEIKHLTAEQGKDSSHFKDKETGRVRWLVLLHTAVRYGSMLHAIGSLVHGVLSIQHSFSFCILVLRLYSPWYLVTCICLVLSDFVVHGMCCVQVVSLKYRTSSRC